MCACVQSELGWAGLSWGQELKIGIVDSGGFYFWYCIVLCCTVYMALVFGAWIGVWSERAKCLPGLISRGL